MIEVKRRHAVLGLLSISYLVCYLDRMAMASAIPFIARDFGLSPLAMGGVLSAFFLGYALMQLPGGILADRFGPLRVIFMSIVAWSLFTAATGVAGSLVALLAIRFCFGLSEGPFPASASKAIAVTFPKAQIGRASGLLLSSVNIGAALSPLVIVPIVTAYGWRAAFFALFLPGIPLALTFLFMRTNMVPPGEVSVRKRGAAIGSLREALAAPGVAWCALALFCGNLGAWGLMNWLPTYLLEGRGLSAMQMSVVAPFPYLVGAGGYMAGGLLLDHQFKDRPHRLISCAMVLGAIMVSIAGFAPNIEVALPVLLLGFLFVFVGISALFALPLLLTPSGSAGSAFGLVNTAASLAAFLSPLLVGFILQQSGRDFALAMYGIALLLSASGLVSVQLRPR